MNQTEAIRPSARTRRLGFSEIVTIRNQVLAMVGAGRSVIRLEGGEPFAPTPDFVKEAIKRALDQNQTRYAPSSGIPPLLEAVRTKLAERNRIEAPASRIIVVNGGAHGLFCSFQATLDEGDEAIFLSPHWTPIRDLVSYAGGTAVPVPWRELDGAAAAEVIGRRITPRTRLIYVNTPSNPTGKVLSRSELEGIARLAVDRDLLVISDEAYEDLVWEEPHVSIGSLAGMERRTITVFTLSKSFSLTGGRIGYVVADEAIMDAIRRLVLSSTNGVSTPTQFGALAAISDRSDHLARMREAFRPRRELLLDAVRAAGLRCEAPRGAFYLFPEVRERLGKDSWAAMTGLLERTGIATVPGAVFGSEGEGHLRMSFSMPMEVLEQAAAALRRL
ncbi:MAG TPA: aminotransferase class I/II-fold pyridoxal phosphate-dependent enzyme [Thermoanaerobaculia bacterium]|nr:aminotransferase class I/II-fold pyridoxal phosphate-dependent enzyme [Thermoanaerobaculia bacterium]